MSTAETIEALANKQVCRGDVGPWHKSQSHKLFSPQGWPLFSLPVHKDSSGLRHYLASTLGLGKYSKSLSLAAALRNLSTMNFVQTGSAQHCLAIITRWRSAGKGSLAGSEACGCSPISFLQYCWVKYSSQTCRKSPTPHQFLMCFSTSCII